MKPQYNHIKLKPKITLSKNIKISLNKQPPNEHQILYSKENQSLIYNRIKNKLKEKLHRLDLSLSKDINSVTSTTNTSKKLKSFIQHNNSIQEVQNECELKLNTPLSNHNTNNSNNNKPNNYYIQTPTHNISRAKIKLISSIVPNTVISKKGRNALIQKPEIEIKKPIFSSTVNLNNFFIRSIRLSDSENIITHSKDLEQISKESYEKINELKTKRLYKLTNKNYYNGSKSFSCRKYSEKDMKQIKNKFYAYVKKKRLERNLNVFNQIKDSLNIKQYTTNSEFECFNYNNLKRVIELKKILSKSNEHKYMENHKQKVKTNNNKRKSTNMKYCDIPSFTKTKFRNKTIYKYNLACNSYFGLPV